MEKYALLMHPGHNRVYFESAKKLAKAELSLTCNNIYEVEEKTIGGLEYITFACEKESFFEQIETISRLSFVFGIFEYSNGLLLPIDKVANYFVDEDISVILKYVGKTNELFTRFMLNIGRNLVSDKEIFLLDPVAGKGTTLYEGLMQNMNVFGIELNDKVAQESYTFVKKYLENKRIKHSTNKIKISGENKSFVANKYGINILADKEKKKFLDFSIIGGNSFYADKMMKKDSINLIVGDLPYGVQHQNVAISKGGSGMRNPAELLSACLPHWANVLKKNGVLVISWNTFLLPREKFCTILENNGFAVIDKDIFRDLEHRVDQAIMRDVIFAYKK